MDILQNPFRGTGIAASLLAEAPYPSTRADLPAALLAQCPAHGETPLVGAADLAGEIGAAQLHVKDERARMGLGSFKALGAAYVIAHLANEAGGDIATSLRGRTFVTASAGNHGLSVAAGARLFGARSAVYIADTVPETFARRLAEKGAQVVREGADYEASMEAAQKAASDNGWTLLSDSSWPGYMELPHRLMEGYLAMAAEAATQLAEPPTHILLQAGVGGLAGAVAAHARAIWGDAPRIIVVEPAAARALQASIAAGQPVHAPGPASSMGRLDCKEPSLIALHGLSKDADAFLTISDDEVAAQLPRLTEAGLETTPSGGAALAALLAPDAAILGDLENARILTFLSEGPE